MSRIYRRGHVWYIDYRSPLNGKRVQKAVSKSKWMAELALKEIELTIAKGKFLGITEPKKILFEKLCDEYLQFSKANKARSSHRRDMTSMQHLLRSFEGILVLEISVADVEQYKNNRRKEVSPATVNRELACLKHMLNKAVHWGYLTEYPLRNVKNFKEPPGRVRYLTDIETEILLNCCYDHIKSIVILALNTGMRKGEILSLKWSDVDMKNRNITVRRTKNNEVRTIPMTDTLYNMLKTMGQQIGEQYVFSNEEGKPYGDIKTGFKAALRRAEIKNFRFHDLRHTFASKLMMNGADIGSVQKLLGHKDITMTMRYSHLSNAHLRETVKRLEVGTNMGQIASAKIKGLVNP